MVLSAEHLRSIFRPTADESWVKLCGWIESFCFDTNVSISIYVLRTSIGIPYRNPVLTNGQIFTLNHVLSDFYWCFSVVTWMCRVVSLCWRSMSGWRSACWCSLTSAWAADSSTWPWIRLLLMFTPGSVSTARHSFLLSLTRLLLWTAGSCSIGLVAV